MSDLAKSMLTVIGTDTGTEHLIHAISVAKNMGARLSVIVMDMTRPSAVSQYGMAAAILNDDTYEHGQIAVEEHARIARSQLEAAGDIGDVITANVMPSEVDDVIADYSRLADLTLLPLKLPVSSAMFRHVLHGALFRAGSPVLLLPPDGANFPQARHAVVAWDSGIQSARAVRGAIGVLGQASRVTVLTIDDKPGQDTLDERLIRYMNSHQIEISFQSHWRENESTGDALLRAAQNLEADLIVMGGYGHSRLREFIVGSTTRQVIELAQLPVLMMH